MIEIEYAVATPLEDLDLVVEPFLLIIGKFGFSC
jgi:hypothetical protein